MSSKEKYVNTESESLQQIQIHENFKKETNIN